jgi:hypothetical protein
MLMGLVFLAGLICAIFGAGVAVGAHHATKVAKVLVAATQLKTQIADKL